MKYFSNRLEEGICEEDEATGKTGNCDLQLFTTIQSRSRSLEAE